MLRDRAKILGCALGHIDRPQRCTTSRCFHSRPAKKKEERKESAKILALKPVWLQGLSLKYPQTLFDDAADSRGTGALTLGFIFSPKSLKGREFCGSMRAITHYSHNQL